MLNPDQTVKDLRDAVDYLATHGWTQGRDFDPEGRCCAFGAIRGALGDDGPEQSDATRNRTSNAARAFYRLFGVDITNYNDTPGRSEAEVVAALEAVAEWLERDRSNA